MPRFDFSILSGKKKVKDPYRKTPKYITLENECEGVIMCVNGIFKVLYDNKIYPVTTESLRTKGRRVVYARRRDTYGHRIKIIRPIGSRPAVPIHCYASIAEGLICRGKLLKNKYSVILFHISSCINPMMIEDDTSKALKALMALKANAR